MTAHIAASVARRPAAARPSATWATRAALEPVAALVTFAVAAVIFVLDATVTIQVIALQPSIVEQNPIARWTLEAHALAPYVLKAAIVAECAVVVSIVRAMDERWAGYVVGGLMAAAGAVGITSAVLALIG